MRPSTHTHTHTHTYTTSAQCKVNKQDYNFYTQMSFIGDELLPETEDYPQKSAFNGRFRWKVFGLVSFLLRPNLPELRERSDRDLFVC